MNESPPVSISGLLARQGHLFEQGPRFACVQCNNGWMNRIEIDAQPYAEKLIHGSWPAMSVAARSAISRWAVLMAITLELADRRTAVFDQDRREAFREHAALDGWMVALGRYDL
ncbi:MAG: hypothetical protein ACLGIM_21300 [Alphaproteobacteria bacterium]